MDQNIVRFIMLYFGLTQEQAETMLSDQNTIGIRVSSDNTVWITGEIIYRVLSAHQAFERERLA